eukprot:11014877-Alexandrium_andersonii.AAC.1
MTSTERLEPSNRAARSAVRWSSPPSKKECRRSLRFGACDPESGQAAIRGMRHLEPGSPRAEQEELGRGLKEALPWCQSENSCHAQ